MAELAPSLADLEKEELDPQTKVTKETENEEVSEEESEESEKSEESQESEEEQEQEEEEEKEEPKSEKKKGKQEKSEEESEEESEEQEETEDSIYKDINNILGFEPEDEFDDSPEGYAEYTKKYGENLLAKMEENLQTNFPQAYAYLLHQMNGGKDEDFFKGQTENWDIELKEDDEQTQEQIVRQDLKKLGWSDKKVDRWVETLRDDDELYNEAKTALEKNQKAKAEADKKRLEEIEKTNAEKKKQIESMSQSISKVIEKGSLKNWIIPGKEKENFNNYVRQNVFFADGKFFIRREISPESLEDELQGEFFRYRKGNLSDLVERQAKSESAKRLKRKTATERKVSPKKQDKQFIGLSNVF